VAAPGPVLQSQTHATHSVVRSQKAKNSLYILMLAEAERGHTAIGMLGVNVSCVMCVHMSYVHIDPHVCTYIHVYTYQ